MGAGGRAPVSRLASAVAAPARGAAGGVSLSAPRAINRSGNYQNVTVAQWWKETERFLAEDSGRGDSRVASPRAFQPGDAESVSAPWIRLVNADHGVRPLWNRVDWHTSQ